MTAEETGPAVTTTALATTAVAERTLAGLVGAVTALASGDLALSVGTVRGWRAAGRTLLPLADRAWTLVEEAGAPLAQSPAIDDLRGFLRGSPADVASVRAALVAVKATHAAEEGSVPGPVADAWSGLRRAYEEVGDAIRAGNPRAAEDALRGAAAVLVPLRDLAAVAEPPPLASAVTPQPQDPSGMPEPPDTLATPSLSDTPATPAAAASMEPGPPLPAAPPSRAAPGHDLLLPHAFDDDDEDALVGPPPAHLGPPEADAIDAMDGGSGDDGLAGLEGPADQAEDLGLGSPERARSPRGAAGFGAGGEPAPWTSVVTVLFVVGAMAAAVIWLFVIANG